MLEEGARGPVMLSLFSDGGPTGCYFDLTEVAEFLLSCISIAACQGLTSAAWIL